MASANTRGGRRRWMLHEEMRAGIAVVDEESLAADAAARRYDFDDQSASFAVASRLLPQSLLSLGGWLVGGIAVTAALAIADSHAATLCERLGIADFPTIRLASPNSLAGWLGNLLLIVAAMLCLLVYGLRRHRLDDFRGKYRRWLAAAAVCGLASLLLSTGLHHSLAQAAATASGYTALPGHAFWWLVPTALLAGGVAVRAALDMRPCRLGLFSLAMAAGLYSYALAGHFNALPATATENFPSPAAQLAGHVWLVVALLAQVRFILLEAAGAIPSADHAKKSREVEDEQPATEKPKHAQSTKSNFWPQQAVKSPVVSMTATETHKATPPQPPAKKSLIAAAKGHSQWVDGRSARDADDEDEDGRPLSKAEKKRLRKEARRAA